MEIRVRCLCGSLFSFDDTPVDGRLEFPIACTNCGTDCTQKANEFIRKKLLNPNSDPTEAAPSKGVFGFLKKKDKADELDHDFSGKAAKAEAAEVNGDETSVVKLISAGLVALLVGCLGAVIWLYVAKLTGFQIGYVAWGLGALVGWSSRLVAPRGHRLLGVVGTLAAFIAIAGGQYLVSRWEIYDEVHRSVPEEYKTAIEFAKGAASAKTDEALRQHVADFKLVRALVGAEPADPIEAYRRYQVVDSALVLLGIVQLEERHKLRFEDRFKLADEANVKPEEVFQFRVQVLPSLKQFAAGKPDESSYQTALAQELMAGITFKSILANSINIYSGLWLLLGLGTAYRLARNPGLKY